MDAIDARHSRMHQASTAWNSMPRVQSTAAPKKVPQWHAGQRLLLVSYTGMIPMTTSLPVSEGHRPMTPGSPAPRFL